MKKLLIFSLITIISTLASATALKEGNIVACELSGPTSDYFLEGEILKVYPGKLRGEVNFFTKDFYLDGYFVKANTVQEVNLKKCHRKLNASETTGSLIRVGNNMTCESDKSLIEDVYENNVVKATYYNKDIRFVPSHYLKQHTRIEKTEDCKFKLADDTVNEEGFKIGNTLTCGIWKGKVIEIYEDSKIILRVTHHSVGSAGTEKVSEIYEHTFDSKDCTK